SQAARPTHSHSPPHVAAAARDPFEHEVRVRPAVVDAAQHGLHHRYNSQTILCCYSTDRPRAERAHTRAPTLLHLKAQGQTRERNKSQFALVPSEGPTDGLAAHEELRRAYNKELCCMASDSLAGKMSALNQTLRSRLSFLRFTSN
ncbi:hypothetical protein DNTS_007703, partial [Danionella cerebrum]